MLQLLFHEFTCIIFREQISFRAIAFCVVYHIYNVSTLASYLSQVPEKKVWERSVTWFKVGAAFLRELDCHVAINARYGRAIDEHTEARLA